MKHLLLFYRNILVVLLPFIMLIRAGAQPSTVTRPDYPGGVASVVHKSNWPAVTQTARPWTRWWWMGSAVDEKNISRLLQAYHDAGLGGVEIVPIYGAIGYETKYLPYLSPRWMHMLDYTVAQASLLDMGVYMSVGTGWPIGGPQVSITDAATKLVVQTWTLKANETLKDKVIVGDEKQKDAAILSVLMAYDDYGQVIDITNKVQANGTLQWQPAQGNWQLYAAFIGKTKQGVKRAAPGGEGFTLDHFSKTALTNYFKTFDTAFRKTSHGVKVFYNDSYEVYGANWTPDLFNVFHSKRGYDLRPYIRDIVSKDSSAKIARIKSDYRETTADMMREHFAAPFTKWSHSKNALSLNQAHGSPGNLLDLYAAVDIPETETFGSSRFSIPGLRRDSADVRNVDPDPAMLKFASSAAHVMGNPLASSETFTWLTEHFKTSWAQCKPEVEQAFLSGINHVFFHGTTYSPAEVSWPGWLFYASVNFVPDNSLWMHLKGMNGYITRCQSVLQSGKPDNEIIAYWPVYDVWNTSKGLDMPLQVHNVDEWLHPSAFYKNLIELQNRGYGIDFVSDKMLAAAMTDNSMLKVSPKGAGYKVLLISRCHMMPVATFKHIIRLARSGATVVLQGFPEDVPGFYQVEERRKEMKAMIRSLTLTAKNKGLSEVRLGKGRIIVCEDAENGLAHANIKREPLVDSGLKFIRRSIDQGKYYYIVNHTAKAVHVTAPIRFAANTVTIMDPQTGETGKAVFRRKQNTTDVQLQLEPGEALIVKATKHAENGNAWKYLAPTNEVMNLHGPWKLHFETGGPALPSDREMKTLQPWTAFKEDSAAQAFSGTAVYSTIFMLPSKDAPDYLLQLGDVHESARVWVNGREAGILWSIPFQARIGQYLKKGENTIAIEVANLMANRIRDMDSKHMEWGKYHEINFVNINYKKFDASGWDVQPSGLSGPVTITAVSY